MIRIVHVISDLDTGGAEMMLGKLILGLDRRRFSNSVISLTDRGQLGRWIESLGASLYTLDMKRGQVDIRAVPRLVRLLRTIKPTIVHSWLYHADLLSTLAAKFASTSFLLWNVRCSDMDLKRYRPLTKLVQRLLAWQSMVPAAVVVNSEAGRLQHARLGYRPRRWELIPNGFDMEQYRPDSDVRNSRRKEWQVSDDNVIIAHVARLDPMKDHATFLKSAQQVAGARPNARFVLIGKDTETLTNAVAACGIQDRVQLLGYRSDVDSLLPAVDVFCLSSAFGEGFPNVLGEAMACGIPCVSTDVGDARSIVGETGIIVPVGNAAALARAMMELIDRGPAGRAALGRAARARIEEKFSLSRIVGQYAALYEDLNVASVR
jgi:glycosyltransferase involved in cell wall biosynthesis